MTRQLEIGPGEGRLPGDWITMDCVARPGVVDHVCTWGAERLPAADDSFDLVYAAHVLEHVPWFRTIAALREARRVLAPGGRIELHVPDLDVLTGAIRAQCCLDDYAEADLNAELHWMHWVAERLFHLGEERQWHRACFNEAHLRWCLQTAGFVNVQRLDAERGSNHGVINLGLAASKPPTAASTATGPRADRFEPVPPSQPLPPGSLPECSARREHAPATGIFFCAHPQVHTTDQLVTAEVCRACDRWRDPSPVVYRPHVCMSAARRDGPCWNLGKLVGWRDCPTCRGQVRVKVFACGHPRHEFATINECLQCPDYEQRLRTGSVRQWAVGVTTAPRAEVTLGRCLDSLECAGWSDAWLFAEPGTLLPDRVNLARVTQHAHPLGAWSNWLLGLAELCQREPLADAYLMIQDDVVFCQNLRSYLEHVLWPVEAVGVVTLYNPRASHDDETGFQRLPTAGGLPGALALAFPNSAARQFLADSQIWNHKWRNAPTAAKLIDVVVGQWAERVNLPAWAHVPSLVQHIGDRTTLWGQAEDAQPRRARTFAGELFDARSLLNADSIADPLGETCSREILDDGHHNLAPGKPSRR